jgi:hypothetical protein
MRRFALAIVPLAAAAAVATASAGGSGPDAARAQRGPGLTGIQKRLLSGSASEQKLPGTAAKALRAPRRQDGGHGSGHGSTAAGCPTDLGSNTRLNQDCLNLTDPDLQGRGQAQNETSIAVDRYDASNVLASSNDYRRGDGGCYAYHSHDNGRTFSDSTPPTGFVRGDTFGAARQYWQGGGDTSVAFDTKGNAYLSCQAFNRGLSVSNNPDQSSGLYVLRSTGSGGASWNFPPRPVAEVADLQGTGAPFLDKQLMTVDNHKGSPFQDRVYVTWTLFDADGTSYIYGAYSSDYGEHFSAPVVVSRDSDLCPLTFGVPTPQGRCNVNQFSQPFTGPDGALYVTWANFNVTDLKPAGEDEGDGGDGGEDLQKGVAPVGKDNRGQMLLARSTDGGQTFSAPVKVSDYYDLPDCATYQDADEGRACVPEKGPTAHSYFRAVNYPSGAVDPSDPQRVVVTFGSYLNRHSNEANGCVPQGFNPDTFQALYDGVKTPGACNNDIVVSSSRDGGASFTGGSTDVRKLPAARPDDPRADQFWQWADISPRGKLAVSYYDRAYGSDEYTGYSDVSLSGSRDDVHFNSARVTSGSMPPPTQFEGDFFGDYAGLSAADGKAHPAWMDTRDLDLFVCRDAAGDVVLPPRVCTMEAENAPKANDQNAYTRTMQVP